jgi:hypothetical protein
LAFVIGAAGAVTTLSVMGTGCGGSDPFCGDGDVDDGEQCDDGNDDQTDFCRNCTVFLPATTTVQWEFNKEAAPMFTGDSCIDLGVSRVEVQLTGPVNETMDEGCSLRQVVFSDLPAGQYVASVRALNTNGDILTDAPIEQTLSIPGSTNQEFEVVIPYDAWTGTYTGSFYFRMRWGGQDCAAATPPVVDHVMTLTQGGPPLSISTTDDNPLDGTPSGTCVSFIEEFPQSALDVPFGPARFRIVGLDNVGTPQFDHEFDTFIGAGVSNPEFEFDVNSLTPDAGVPDAGVADASVPDAGM